VKILIFILLLTFCTGTVLAIDEDTCVNYNHLRCNDCVNININLTSFEGGNILFVGDVFYYNITIKNTGLSDIQKTFLVDVFDPLNRSLSHRVYKLELIKSNETQYLFPNQSKSIHDIYPLDVIGVYRIEVKSDGVIYHKIYENCAFLEYVTTYKQSFDVMPKWEYAINKQNEKLQEQNLEMNKESTSLNQQIKQLTIAMLILAFIPIIIELSIHAKNRWKTILALEGIFFGIAIFIGVFVYNTYYYDTNTVRAGAISMLLFGIVFPIMILKSKKNSLAEWLGIVFLYIFNFMFLTILILHNENNDIISTTILVLISSIGVVLPIINILSRRSTK